MPAVAHLAICAALLLVNARAEKLFHDRDHGDIQQTPDNEADPIDDTESVQQYLLKYGWVKPVNWKAIEYENVSIPLNDDPAPSNVIDSLSEGDTVSRDKVEETKADPTQSPYLVAALKNFQAANGLPQTGQLDDETKAAMNKPRCGVPDKQARNNNNSNSSSSTRPVNETQFSDYNSRNNNISNSNNSRSDGATTASRGLLADLVTHARSRRAVVVDTPLNPGLAFSKSNLKWRLIGEGYSSQFTTEEQRFIVRLAFRMWSEVIPLIFEEDLKSPSSDIDIKLGFGTGRHLGCSQVFDGSGQEFAHAWHLGDVHFDDDEQFSTPRSEQGISLLKVAVHEIGHVLGLPHLTRQGSIMQPNYIPQDNGFELEWLDRKAIQQIYGVCDGSFSTVFDWVRQERNQLGVLVTRFNTYFFRDRWYWMYENRNNRTRFGDPIALSVGWRGIPDSAIDAYVHVWTWNINAAYFFKGTQYWRYDNANDRVYTVDPQGVSYPKLISDGFPNVPNPVNTAFYDRRDYNIYFFKNNDVTAFNVNTQQKVSGYPKRVTDVFPAVVAGDHPGGNLDAVYYSYTHMAIFFFKGDYFWKVVDDRDRQANPALPYNGLLARRRVSDQWFDICDVHISMLTSASK
ncbi:matrix metalloproteinase-21-like [Petromyzon marinus]|uniref:Matrix metalloproteinase-21-like n=1 Tax=Petromyzon marinus TaxID=7757 RepID=A0AAJ7SYY7_PETMA|nr:matrix metalloproteinase-21-like [Petromyzon marinus]